MSLNPKRLPVIKSRRDKVTKLTENCTKMWSNSFADVAHMLSLLGHCQYKDNRGNLVYFFAYNTYNLKNCKLTKKRFLKFLQAVSLKLVAKRSCMV